MRKLALAVAAAAVLGLFAGSAYALPSSKAAIVQGDLFGLASACKLATQGGNPLGLVCVGTGGPEVADTGWNPVMTTFIKTPNGKELAFDVGLQCALITFTQAKAKGGGGSGNDKAAAEGRISVRVAITPVDRDGNDTGDTSYALPNNDGNNPLGTDAAADGPDGVTYCFRNQELEVSFDNLVCEEGEDCEIAVSLLLETLNAHAFNFVAPNVTPGIKRIDIEARATAAAAIFGGDGNAKGEAFIGMGSTLIETVRAVQAFDENTPTDPVITDLE